MGSEARLRLCRYLRIGPKANFLTVLICINLNRTRSHDVNRRLRIKTIRSSCQIRSSEWNTWHNHMLPLLLTDRYCNRKILRCGFVGADNAIYHPPALIDLPARNRSTAGWRLKAAIPKNVESKQPIFNRDLTVSSSLYRCILIIGLHLICTASEGTSGFDW